MTDYDYGFEKGYKEGFSEGVEEFATFLTKIDYPNATEKAIENRVKSLMKKFEQDHYGEFLVE